jgi:D-glycero-D-manno-heptose 1,7-bisphosphate phosphatase
MGESSKTLLHHGNRLAKYLQGDGLDIGPGNDPVRCDVVHFDREHGDASRIDEYLSRKFDYVWSSHCLEHLDDPTDALRRWWSLVKPGGYLIVVVPDEDLYEQGYYPSRLNGDHRSTFTLSSRPSWSPVSHNLRTELDRLGGEGILFEVQDDGLDHSLLSAGPTAISRPILGFWCVVAAVLRVVRVPLSVRFRVARRRGHVIDQTLLPDARLAQLLAVVRKPTLENCETEADGGVHRVSRHESFMVSAVFLDRDGTVIVDSGYLCDPDEVRLLEGAAVGLRAMRDAGLQLVVVSNQSGIGRSRISASDAARVHDRFVWLLAEHGIVLAGSYYCPHAPAEGCSCRKPSIGMFTKAESDLGLNLADAVMIGDKLSDVEAGQAAGCRTILLADPGADRCGAWQVVPDLESAARVILGAGQ